MEAKDILKETSRKMDQSLDLLRTDLAGVRAGRANPTLLDTITCLLYTSPSPRDATLSRMPSSA